MSCINWGLQNEHYQPIIAPTADRDARRASGDPVPARPDWLCLTSPEFSPDAGFNCYPDKRTLTPEQREARAAQQRADKAERDRLKEIEADERRAQVKAKLAHEKKLREQRAADNKKKGFGPKKSRGKQCVKMCF